MGRPYGKGCSSDVPGSFSDSEERSSMSSESELCAEDERSTGSSGLPHVLAQDVDLRFLFGEGLPEGSVSDSEELDTRNEVSVFLCFLYQLD